MEKLEITVLRPDFYDDFRCKGFDCQYTCCQEWRVDLDKKTFKTYHNLRQPKELAEQLKKYVVRNKESNDDRLYGQILMEGVDGRCPFQNEKGLCGLQLTLGEKNLSVVCRDYPRNKNIFSGRQEIKLQYSLSFGCEKVVEMLLAEKEGIGFIEEKLLVEKQFWNGGVDPDHIEKTPLKAYWEEIQYLSIDILQDRRYPLEKRLLFLGLFCRRLMKTSAEEAMETIRGFRHGYFDSNDFTQLDELAEADGAKQLSFCTNLFNHTELSYRFLRHGIMQTIIANLHLPIRGAESSGQSEEEPFERYIQAYERYQMYMADKEHLLENILVMEIVRKIFPFQGETESIWENYLWLCCLFVVLRFLIIGMIGEKGELTREKLIDILAVAGRNLAHNRDLWKSCLEFMQDNDLTSLAKLYTLLAPPQL